MRDITSQLRDAVLNRLHALPDGSASQRLQAIVGGNFDETQISSAAMKAGWPSGPAACTSRCFIGYSRSAAVACCRTVYEFRRELPREQRRRPATGWRR